MADIASTTPNTNNSQLYSNNINIVIINVKARVYTRTKTWHCNETHNHVVSGSLRGWYRLIRPGRSTTTFATTDYSGVEVTLLNTLVHATGGQNMGSDYLDDVNSIGHNEFFTTVSWNAPTSTDAVWYKTTQAGGGGTYSRLNDKYVQTITSGYIKWSEMLASLSAIYDPAVYMITGYNFYYAGTNLTWKNMNYIASPGDKEKARATSKCSQYTDEQMIYDYYLNQMDAAYRNTSTTISSAITANELGTKVSIDKVTGIPTTLSTNSVSSVVIPARIVIYLGLRTEGNVYISGIPGGSSGTTVIDNKKNLKTLADNITDPKNKASTTTVTGTGNITTTRGSSADTGVAPIATNPNYPSGLRIVQVGAGDAMVEYPSVVLSDLVYDQMVIDGSGVVSESGVFLLSNDIYIASITNSINGNTMSVIQETKFDSTPKLTIGERILGYVLTEDGDVQPRFYGIVHSISKKITEGGQDIVYECKCLKGYFDQIITPFYYKGLKQSIKDIATDVCRRAGIYFITNNLPDIFVNVEYQSDTIGSVLDYCCSVAGDYYYWIDKNGYLIIDNWNTTNHSYAMPSEGTAISATYKILEFNSLKDLSQSRSLIQVVGGGGYSITESTIRNAFDTVSTSWQKTHNSLNDAMKANYSGWVVLPNLKMYWMQTYLNKEGLSSLVSTQESCYANIYTTSASSSLSQAGNQSRTFVERKSVQITNRISLNDNITPVTHIVIGDWDVYANSIVSMTTVNGNYATVKTYSDLAKLTNAVDGEIRKTEDFNLYYQCSVVGVTRTWVQLLNPPSQNSVINRVLNTRYVIEAYIALRNLNQPLVEQYKTGNSGGVLVFKESELKYIQSPFLAQDDRPIMQAIAKNLADFYKPIYGGSLRLDGLDTDLNVGDTVSITGTGLPSAETTTLGVYEIEFNLRDRMTSVSLSTKLSPLGLHIDGEIINLNREFIKNTQGRGQTTVIRRLTY